MVTAFYAGSFDPFTTGHLHIVKTASKLFDRVVVGICVNPKKKRIFDRFEIKEAIEKLFDDENLKNVICTTYEGFTVDEAKKFDTNVLIRGVRNAIDYDFEESLALVNEELSGLDTIFIRAGEFGAISSSMVNELIKNDREVSKYVPKYVIDVVKPKGENNNE